MSEKMDLIWESKLDDVYQCEVARIDADTGHLTVTGPDGARLLDERVPLAYGAMFGPDVDDVHDWELRCIAAIDDGDGYHPMFPIEPGTPEEEEATLQQVAQFFEISVNVKGEKARTLARDMIAKMRQQIKDERLDG